MTNGEFDEAMNTLQDLYGRTMPGNQLDAWWKKFRMHSLPAFKRAIDLAAQDAKGFPGYGQVLKQLGEHRTREDHDVEWLEEMREIAAERGQPLDQWLSQRARVIANRGIWCD